MYTTPAVVLAVLGSALALPQFMPRDDAPDFTDADLLASCPGGPGTKKLERADRCTLEDPVTIPNVRKFTVIGNPQLNCDGGSEAISVQLGGQTTITQTTTVSADVGFEVDELKIGGGVETSSSKSSTFSRQVTYSIPPKRQAVYVAGQNYQAQSAHVQVNYGDRQFGHFIWFTNENVTHLTAILGDIEFDVHESACGSSSTSSLR
ncbi:hypothetical protein BC628DRAFT_1409594 [Trametes gibbosa]|nr:hypothetical protein BC628DRAFT_1409594 [Trametes gibbosa]